jgi:hypothetical protein
MKIAECEYVSRQYIEQFEMEPETNEEPASSPLRTIAAFIVLALVGVGPAFLLRGYSDQFAGFATPKSELPAQRVTLQAFEEYRQATTADLLRIREMLQAQGIELKQLADQVSQLTTKIDALQTARNAQAAVASTVSKPIAQKQPAKPPPHNLAVPAPLSLAPQEKH